MLGNVGQTDQLFFSSLGHVKLLIGISISLWCAEELGCVLNLVVLVTDGLGWS